MTTTVAVVNGIGTQYGRLAAYDRAAVVSISGLASEFYSVAVTGILATADGATALSPIATGTVSSAGAVSLTFDLDTPATALLMAGRADDGSAVLTVYATGTEANACIAAMKVSQASDHGLTTASTDATPASLEEVQELIAAAGGGKPSTAKTTPADADGFTLWDSIEGWAGKFLSWANLKTALGAVFAAITHASRHGSAGADPVIPAAIGAATAAQGALAASALQPAGNGSQLTGITASQVGAIATSIGTTAGDTIAFSGSATPVRRPCAVALDSAGAGVWAPALTAGAGHTCTRTGIFSDIAPTGLQVGEKCTVIVSGAHAVSGHASCPNLWSGADTDLGAASVLVLFHRTPAGYRLVARELA